VEKSQRKSLKAAETVLQPMERLLASDKDGSELKNYLCKLKKRQECDSLTMSQMY